MLPDRLIKRIKRSLKRHQTGQAIIILALGFIVLLGFVGIVTDVSLLYIRYAALRRAVDSAAVAAAGQLRTDRAATAPKLAAMQFLEFHGIDTSNVYVETCVDMPPFWADPASPDHRDDDGNVLPADAPERESRKDLYDEVCDDQRKLVRVTAFIESPTVFMSLPPFNYETITLSAASVSETATLDVVVVLDVSESMLFETTYEDWNALLPGSAQWARYLPPRMSDVYAYYNGPTAGQKDESEVLQHFLRNYTQADFLAGNPFTTSGLENPSVELDLDPAKYYMDGSVPRVFDRGSTMNRDMYNINTVVPQPPNVFEMRTDCRVRIHPYSALLRVDDSLRNPNDIADIDTLLGQWIELTRNYDTDILNPDEYVGWRSGQFDMFRPAYDFYGCCNDPTAGATVDENGNITLGPPAGWITQDFDFSDLVCEPFKTARDRTRDFLQNIDFARGDRIAFVTFDRAAYLIDPDGYSYGAGSDAAVRTGGAAPHMIDNYTTALEVLNRVIGVRAEPNFYYTNHNAFDVFGNPVSPDPQTGVKPVDLWEGYSSGARTVAADVDGNGEVGDGEVAVIGTPLDTSAYYGQPIGEVQNGYHVRGSCPYNNAALPQRYSIWAQDDTGFWGGAGPLYNVMLPPVHSDAGWYDHYDDILDGSSDFKPEEFAALFSYENLGSCRGTNVGAGLREANNALVSPLTTRQIGAVWVIVLLGDGAAGATDPVLRDSTQTDVVPAQPYKRNPDDGDPNNPPAPEQGEYGAYGFCPYGTTGALTGLTDDTAAPYCVDPNPNTRHSCNTDVGGGDPWDKAEWEDDSEIDGVLEQYVSGNRFVGTDDECLNQYDADDYARDWADYVAMDRRQLSGEQLPIIFTIGFNLGYPDAPEAGETWCTANLQMCLGEELLRYIANVGDNNQYDPNEYPNTFEDGDDRGQSYGNYFIARTEQELAEVFDIIASKLFTRIAG